MRFSFFLMALCFLHSSPVLSDGDNTIFELEDFAFESGATLPNARLSYVTYGALNESKTNVVHRPSWYSANHHGYEFLSGPGKALDSSEYFIVATDMFANGLTSSPSNTPPPFAGPDFPEIAIRDNVNATHRLLTEELGVEHLRAVIGFSMGAQQAFQWAVSHPDMVEAAVAICGNAKEYPFGIVRLEGAKSALMATLAAHGRDANNLLWQAKMWRGALRQTTRGWPQGACTSLGHVGRFARVVAPRDLPRARLCQHRRAPVGGGRRLAAPRREQLALASQDVAKTQRGRYARLRERFRESASLHQSPSASHALGNRFVLSRRRR